MNGRQPVFHVRLGFWQRQSTAAILGSLCTLPSIAAAQPAASVMTHETATAGSAEVAGSTFDTVKKPEDPAAAKDATEAKIQAGGLSAAGNSRSLALTSVANLRVRRSLNEVSVAAAANFGRSAAAPNEKMKTSVENYQGKLRYDRFVSERFALFVAQSGRKDRFQGLDLRLNLDPGVAYYLLDEPKHQLWAELGYDLQFDIIRDESIVDAFLANGEIINKTNTRHSARVFAGYRNTLSETLAFTTGVEYLQGIPETKFWRLNWDAGINTSISTAFSLATTFSLKYDHQPLSGIKSTDTITALNLVYQLL